MSGFASNFAGKHTPRRGMIFVTTLGVVVILSGLVLVFAQSMRTEAIASANRLCAAEADAIEQGAEQWVLAQVDANPGDALTITQIPAEEMQVGKGYFWLLRPVPDNDRQYDFGIIDESAKVNLNYATSDPTVTNATTLLYLPNITEDVADNIFAWRSPINLSGTSNNSGAQSDFYESLGYDAKNAPFETVEELFLVKDVTDTLLYGYDLNRDGVLSDAERATGGTAADFNSAGSDSRGFFNYVTVYSVEPNTAVDGSARTSVNDRNTTALLKVLTDALQSKRAGEVMAKLAASYAPPRPGPRGPATVPAIIFANIGDFYAASGMTSAEFALVADKLTATAEKTLPGLINVNTAPKQTLMCLPQMTESDADAITAQRDTGGADPGSIAWVFDVLTPAKARAIAGSITTRSFQYSADIVAVSGDGRAFKRVRIVVDAQKSPAKIVYRRDLTSLGWPLDVGVRNDLRSGVYQVGTGSSRRTTSSNGGMNGGTNSGGRN